MSVLPAKVSGILCCHFWLPFLALTPDLFLTSGTTALVSANVIQHRKGVGKKIGDGVQFFFTLFFGLAYGFWSSWQIALLVFAVVPYMAISTLLLMKLVSTQSQQANLSYAKAGSIVYTTVRPFEPYFPWMLWSIWWKKLLPPPRMPMMELPSRWCKWTCQWQYPCLLLAHHVPVALYGSYLLYQDVQQNCCDSLGSSLENPPCEPVLGVGVFGAMFKQKVGSKALCSCTSSCL